MGLYMNLLEFSKGFYVVVTYMPDFSWNIYGLVDEILTLNRIKSPMIWVNDGNSWWTLGVTTP